MRPGRRHAHRELAVLPRLVELSQTEETGRRADQAAGVLRIALDDLLEGLDRFGLHPLSGVDLGELQPDVGHFRIVGEHFAIERGRFGEAQVSGEIGGVPVFLEHADLVLRIGQRSPGSDSDALDAAADVAERGEPLPIFVGDRGRRFDRGVRDQRLERRAHRLAHLRAVAGDRGGLLRIAFQVVELVARRADQPVSRVGQSVQLAPAEVIAGVERLGIDPGVGQRAGAFEQRPERAPAQVASFRARRRDRESSAPGRCAGPAPRRAACDRWPGSFTISGTWIVSL